MSQQSASANMKEKISTNINKQSRLINTLADTDNAVVAAVDSVKKLVKKGNKFTEGIVYTTLTRNILLQKTGPKVLLLSYKYVIFVIKYITI